MTDRSDKRVEDDLVVIGEVVKPHGIRGEVKAYLFSEQPGNIEKYNEIVLQDPAGAGTGTYKVVKSRPQGKLAILQLEAVVTREDAESLQGSKILISKDDFPSLDADEYYWHQLQGLAVITDAGQELGRVARIFNTTAHDIMVVTGAGDEYMIPLQGDIISEIDAEGGKIIITPPLGLLEINK